MSAREDRHEARPRKRQRLEEQQLVQEQQTLQQQQRQLEVEELAPAAAAAAHGKDEGVSHVLYIRWGGEAGQTKVNRLPLRFLHGNSTDALEELPKELLEAHYPPAATNKPAYLTAPEYVRFTPEVECLALPGGVVRTELRLALVHRSWEYTVLKHTAQHEAPPGAPIHVLTAEFLGSDPLMAALGLRVSLIAYPVVAISKAFLEAAHERLLAAPDSFRGEL